MITQFTYTKQLILICFLALLPSIVNAQKYTITADLKGFPEHTKFYLKDLAAQTDIDSAEIVNDKFVMSGRVSAPRTYWLYCHVKQNFYYTTLLIGADKVKVTGTALSFPFYLTISGSPSHDVFNIGQTAIRVLYTERDSLMQLVIPLLSKDDEASKATSRSMIKRVNYIDSVNNIIKSQFVTNHLNSYAALISMYELRKSYAKTEIQAMLNKLKPEFKGSSFGQRLVNYLKVGDPVKKGDMMADFQALDEKGKTHSLSSLKGKYILLDFTETYCGPCYLSSGDLHNLAYKYPEQLTIVSFYVDGNKKVWMEGVKRDKPTWLTLWDGQGQYGETLLKYAVDGYPTFVMIDPAGKIISKSSGYGKTEHGKGSLEEAVDKILGGK